MRLAAYAGASTALAGAVVLRAFAERPNFYSAAVYLGQSNACRMILMNFLLLSAGSVLYALQRLLYGPLRPREVEQLWDNGWYAVTETALAMTTFRDEVGGWFFILFMSLLAGKIWGWIGASRLEYLEQQPPANPRLFHARLIASLFVSEIFDVLMLQYCVQTLQEQPRPGMMVMFAFEFAVLVITSTSTLARYGLTLRETIILRQQIQAKVVQHRQQLRERAQSAASPEEADALTREADGDVDESEMDVPGWQEKGKWVLILDLVTDFLKLNLYLGFFFVLLIFSGIPLHMFRDLYMTMKSFFKRINDYLKYRHATKDMNSRYPDATAEELSRDGTCIICREDMRPWQPHASEGAQPSPSDERQRPKKLPCGHILHVSCLRSWLERQQVCPTCRAPVVVPQVRNGQNATPGQAQADVGGNHALRNALLGNQEAQNGNQADALRRNAGGLRARTWGFGNFRLTLAAGNGGAIRRALQDQQQQQQPQQTQNSLTTDLRNILESMQRLDGQQYRSGESIRQDLDNLERRLNLEIESLQTQRHRLAAVRALQTATEAFRSLPDAASQATSATGPAGEADAGAAASSAAPSAPSSSTSGLPQSSGLVSRSNHQAHAHVVMSHQQSSPTPTPTSTASAPSPMAAGHPQLPPGLVLPEGWTLTPLPPARTPYRMSPPVNLPFGQTHITTRVHVPAPAPTATTHAPPHPSVPAPAAPASPPSATPLPTPPNPPHSPEPSTTSPAPHPSSAPAPTLPQWGSAPLAGANGTPDADSTPRTGDGREDAEAAGKGKGRQAGVEDTPAEDEDE